MKSMHHQSTTKTLTLETRSQTFWLNVGVGAFLALAATAGAADMALHARWPWPKDALQDPMKVQLLISVLLAYVLGFALVTIIRAFPQTEEHYGHDE